MIGAPCSSNPLESPLIFSSLYCRIPVDRKTAGAFLEKENTRAGTQSKPQLPQQQQQPQRLQLHPQVDIPRRFLQSGDQVRILRPQLATPTTAAGAVVLITPENDNQCDTSVFENSSVTDSLDMSFEDEMCSLTERSDCQNPVALTLLHNTNNNVSDGDNKIREDWSYLNRVDTSYYGMHANMGSSNGSNHNSRAASPAPFAQRPHLPNVISRPRAIRLTHSPLMMMTTCKPR